MGRTMVSFENRTTITRVVGANYKREREKKKRKLPTFLDTLYLLLFMFIRMIYIYETEIIPWISIMP